MKSPADQTIIQIDCNSACPKRCSNCTRLVSHTPLAKQWEMPLDRFEDAVESMEGWGGEGKVLGIIGGEVTEHSDFERLARTFADLWGGPLTSNGRKPIADYKQFVQERLFDRSSQRGLWSSLGKAFARHIETIYEVFSHFNINTHEGSAALHQASLIHRKDYVAATGISQEQWEHNRDNCKLQEMWSASIFPSGPYFCEVAGALDTLLFDGKHAWPLEKGWWQRTPADFKDQLFLCDYCSLAQPGPASLDQANRDIISKENELVLVQLGSPAVTKGRFDKYDPEIHCGDRIMDRPDWYVGPDGRVSDEHASVRPKKLSAVVVAVGCSGDLAQTIENRNHFDQLVVVTSTAQHEVYGHVDMVKIDLSPDDAFNKGAYLNAGLAALDHPEWIVFLDADIVLPDNFRDFFFSHSWNPGCIYGVPRRESASPDEINNGQGNSINGYCQIWNPLAHALRPHLDGKLPRISEAFCSAGGVDSWFYQQYPPDKRIMVPELPVEHLDHGAFGDRWNGGRTDPCWRQVGIFFGQRFVQVGSPLPADAAERTYPCRLTDTKFATQHELELVNGSLTIHNVVEFQREGIKFLGRDIGEGHLHVAVKF